MENDDRGIGPSSPLTEGKPLGRGRARLFPVEDLKNLKIRVPYLLSFLGMNIKSLAVVIREYSDQLLAVPGVLGISKGLRNGEPCLQILVEKDTADQHNRYPHTIEYYPVVIKVTGPIQGG